MSDTAAELPRYSQFLDVSDTGWKDRACGIVSLKMLLDMYSGGKSMPSADELIEEGLAIQGYIPNIGWKHASLAELAMRHGLWGKNFDWAKETTEEAFSKMRHYMESGPVIASVHRDFNPAYAGHLMVAVGIGEGGMLLFNDPAAKERDDIPRRAPLADFLTGWKRRIIVIRSEPVNA